MIGITLAGRYKIEAPIGEGGMSRVWRALDQNTGKYVAVKVLRDEYREDETFVRRFEREALAASRMTHPNIANLLDVGVEKDGTRYLVIEYVPGKTLKQFIQESGAIRPEMAAHIIMRVLGAVHHAHQNGVIHRDIKPQNILIDKEGSVKVSDFGIARVANSQTMNQDQDTVMGSVYYFSPEQAKGAAVDEKSDIYSVGVVFYEMLTGQVPFTGDTPVAIAMQHIQNAPIPPGERAQGVPGAMDYVVLHAMEKRPRNRYASAADMLRDVKLSLEHPDTILAAKAEMERKEQAQRQSQNRRAHVEKRVRWMRRAMLAAFSILLLLVIAFAGYTITEQMLISRRQMVEVPSVIGYKSDEGINMLMELELEVIPEYVEYPLVADGVIGEQSIPPGTIARRGDKITIMICQSKFELPAPNLMGMPVSQAQKTIIDLDLIPGALAYETSPATADTVIGQDPPPGTPINRGDEIRLRVSGGQVIMPDLSGNTQAQAEQKVVAYGLIIGNVLEEETDDPALIGKVLRQAPVAYASIRPNFTVEIVIGTPSDTLLEQTITLDVSKVSAGQSITVRLLDESGREFWQHIRTLEEEIETLRLTVYSPMARMATYILYADGDLLSSGTVEFSQ